VDEKDAKTLKSNELLSVSVATRDPSLDNLVTTEPGLVGQENFSSTSSSSSSSSPSINIIEDDMLLDLTMDKRYPYQNKSNWEYNPPKSAGDIQDAFDEIIESCKTKSNSSSPTGSFSEARKHTSSADQRPIVEEILQRFSSDTGLSQARVVWNTMLKRRLQGNLRFAVHALGSETLIQLNGQDTRSKKYTSYPMTSQASEVKTFYKKRGYGKTATKEEHYELHYHGRNVKVRDLDFLLHQDNKRKDIRINKESPNDDLIKRVALLSKYKTESSMSGSLFDSEARKLCSNANTVYMKPLELVNILAALIPRRISYADLLAYYPCITHSTKPSNLVLGYQIMINGTPPERRMMEKDPISERVVKSQDQIQWNGPYMTGAENDSVAATIEIVTMLINNYLELALCGVVGIRFYTYSGQLRVYFGISRVVSSNNLVGKLALWKATINKLPISNESKISIEDLTKLVRSLQEFSPDDLVTMVDNSPVLIETFLGLYNAALILDANDVSDPCEIDGIELPLSTVCWDIFTQLRDRYFNDFHEKIFIKVDDRYILRSGSNRGGIPTTLYPSSKKDMVHRTNLARYLVRQAVQLSLIREKGCMPDFYHLLNVPRDAQISKLRRLFDVIIFYLCEFEDGCVFTTQLLNHWKDTVSDEHCTLFETHFKELMDKGSLFTLPLAYWSENLADFAQLGSLKSRPKSVACAQFLDNSAKSRDSPYAGIMSCLSIALRFQYPDDETYYSVMAAYPMSIRGLLSDNAYTRHTKSQHFDKIIKESTQIIVRKERKIGKVYNLEDIQMLQEEERRKHEAQKDAFDEKRVRAYETLHQRRKRIVPEKELVELRSTRSRRTFVDIKVDKWANTINDMLYDYSIMILGYDDCSHLKATRSIHLTENTFMHFVAIMVERIMKHLTFYRDGKFDRMEQRKYSDAMHKILNTYLRQCDVNQFRRILKDTTSIKKAVQIPILEREFRERYSNEKNYMKSVNSNKYYYYRNLAEEGERHERGERIKIDDGTRGEGLMKYVNQHKGSRMQRVRKRRRRR
jgi:DNA-binding Xre family transcriptional regulator